MTTALRALSLPTFGLSPSRQFAAFSLAILLLIGGVEVYVLSAEIEEQMTESAASLVGTGVRGMIRQQISVADLRAPMTGERYNTFDAFVRANILSDQVARIKIWNRDGLIVYADDRTLVGRSFAVEDELAEALETEKTVAELSSVNKPENRSEQGLGPLLEIYVPLVPRDAAAVDGVYEVYLYDAPIAASVSETQRTVWLATIFGVGALWTVLYWVFRGASQKLQLADAHRRRATHLALLNEIGAEAASTLAGDELLRRTTAAIRRQFANATVTVALLRDDGTIDPGSVIAAGAEAGEAPFAMHPPILQALRELKDVVAEDRAAALHGSELSVPLVEGGRTMGILNLRSAKRGAFSPDDMSALRAIAQQLTVALANARMYGVAHQRAMHDELTGAGNRAFFDDALRQATLPSGGLADLSLLVLDLNGFKRINDAYGHEAGDVVLREVAARLQGCVRERDTVARIGGDEFAILLPAAPQASAIRVAAAIGRALELPIVFAGRSFTVGTSIGIAIAHEHATDGDALQRAADAAMYAAKRAGEPYKLAEPPVAAAVSRAPAA